MAVRMPAFCPRSALRDQSGAISVVAALSIMMLLAVAAIVVDIGSLYLARRNLQSTNDAAALAAVQNPAEAGAVVAAVFARNGYAGETLTVTAGTYTADESLGADARFAASNANVNAVRVRATVQQPAYLFGVFGLTGPFALTTQSTAARIPTASFGAGTRLAELNGGLINSILGQLWGSNVSLSLVDYQALLSTNVDALTFLDQLATDINVTGSYHQLADASVSMGQILTALAETTAITGASSGDPAAARLALQSLELQLAGGTQMQLANLIDLSPLYGRTIGGVVPSDNQGLQLNLMSLMSASATNQANGRTTNIGTTLSIPVTNSSVTTRLAVNNQMEQISSAGVGSTIQTQQIRIALTLTLANINLGVAMATVQVPLYLEVAPGQAILTAMPCTTGGTLVEIAGTSGATSVQYGTVSDAALNNFSASVTPVAAPIVTISLLGIPIQVNAVGSYNVAGAGPQTLSFSQADIDAGTVKSVSGGSGAPFTALGAGTTLSASILANPGPFASLLNTQLTALLSALNPVVTGALGQLDSPVNSLLTTLGIQTGVLDVRAFDASCRTPALVG